ncbi:hypothetical protein [Niabella aquatica]
MTREQKIMYIKMLTSGQIPDNSEIPLGNWIYDESKGYVVMITKHSITRIWKQFINISTGETQPVSELLGFPKAKWDISEYDLLSSEQLKKSKSTQSSLTRADSFNAVTVTEMPSMLEIMEWSIRYSKPQQETGALILDDEEFSTRLATISKCISNQDLPPFEIKPISQYFLQYKN